MVIKQTSNSYSGIEINILNSMANIMNFSIDYYETFDTNEERWGRQLNNGSFSGLLGEMV